jgi:thiol:disulfide interchange protein DsbD
VDFTADWCLTCKVNESTVLASSTVTETFRRHGVALLKGDWTRRDPRITKSRARVRRARVTEKKQ